MYKNEIWNREFEWVLDTVRLFYLFDFEEAKHFYSNVEKIRLYYDASNFAINQPMLPVISNPLYR